MSTKARGFVIAKHAEYGFLVLESAKNGYHFQLPGGRGGEADFAAADGDLERAAMIAAARELDEETGIDVKRNLGRLVPLQKHLSSVANIGNRRFFFLELTDADSLPRAGAKLTEDQLDDAYSYEPAVTTWHSPKDHFKMFTLRMSLEHNSFDFIEDVLNFADSVKHHSGGKCTAAIMTLIEKRILKTDQ